MKYEAVKIGENSGKIWEALNTEGALSLKTLEEKTGVKKDELLLAVGWLMKEEKVAGKKEGRTEVLYLK